MSIEDSGYAGSWHRNMAQPDSTNIPFESPDMSKQSQPLQSDQYPFQHNSYRDLCGTSVSGLDSQPDYFTQNTFDEVPDQDFDPIQSPPIQDLAGIPLFDMDLNLDPSYQPMTPNTPRYHPDLTQSSTGLSFMSNNELPWSEYSNLPRNDNMIPNQPQIYDEAPPSKRPRLQSDSGIGTQRSSPSSAFNPTQRQRRSHQTQGSQYLLPPANISTQRDGINSPHSQEQPQRASSFSGRRHTSPSPSQQSPPRSVPKAQRKASYFCDHCQPLPNFAGFGTRNDLDRHIKAVHGSLQPGEKIWICKIEGCVSSGKSWPRRDNFQSHLKRMHFGGDDNKARSAVDQFQESYSLEVHGSIASKTGNSRNSRSKSNQNLPPSVSGNKRASVPNPSTLQQPFMGDMASQSHGTFNFLGGMNSSIPGSLTSSTLNHCDPAATALRSGPASSPFFQSPHYETLGKNMTRPGDAHTAPPNPDNWFRQRLEIQEQDQAVPLAPRNGRSVVEDLNSIGIGIEHNNTVDPALLHSTRSGRRSIDLNATRGGSKPGLDPEKELEDMLKNLSPEQRGMLRSLPAETIVRYINKFEQVGEADKGQNSSKRSVPKSSTKKHADGQKTLKCTTLIEKKGEKGEKEKTLVQCPARFSLQSELRKHRKRHEKRFGCTFDECYSKFGTKWEWKRHEQSQHIQNEAWRCRYMDGETGCQQLFSDRQDFEEHLTEHFDESDTKVSAEEFAEKVEECHLFKKCLGSYWCGYCQRVVRSQRNFGREMVEERVEHIGDHIDQGDKSSDWVELGAGGRTKGEMKESKEGGSTPGTHSSQAKSGKQSSHDGIEEEEEDDEEENEENEDDDDNEDDEGNDSDEARTGDLDESNSPAKAQQPRPKLQTLDVHIAQNSTNPPSSQGSRTEPLSSTPTIQLETPEGRIMMGHGLDSVYTGPLQQQRTHTDNAPTGHRRQQQQHYQAQLQTHSQPQPHPQQMQTLLRCCCVCRRTPSPWGIYQGKCEYPDCPHQCDPFCPYTTSQDKYMPGYYSNDDDDHDDSGYGYYVMGV